MIAIEKIIACLVLANCLLFPAFSQNKPNVILILADDQGWGTTSVMMNKNIPASKSDFIKTPNLERLAAQSIIIFKRVCGTSELLANQSQYPYRKIARPIAAYRYH